MKKAKFFINDWGYYEIDFYNDSSKEEIEYLSKKLDIHEHSIKKCFLKRGDSWIERISGMTFDIKNFDYYGRLKNYLDERFRIYSRKIKLQKIIIRDEVL